ncbi:hypothetical protein ACKVMT_05335 [Halobacteriales archaeon Cl-PHB]
MLDETDRRRFLLAATGGLATTIAGCQDTQDNDTLPDITPRATDDEPDPTPVETPDSPAARFKYKGETEGTFIFKDAPAYEGFGDTDASSLNYRLPDSRLTTASIADSGDTLEVSIEQMQIDRPISVRAKLNTNSGVKTTDPQRISQTSSHRTHDLEFDISGFDLPELETGYVHVLAEDSHDGAHKTRLLKVHRYLGIPYENAEGSHVYYLEDEDVFNHQSYKDPEEGTSINHDPQGEQARATVETEDDATVFLGTLKGNDVIGGSTTYSKDDLGEYLAARENNHRPSEFKPPHVIYNAPDIPRISVLAHQLGETFKNAGITDQFRKLSALSTIVQTIPYKEAGGPGESPIFVFYKNDSNCTERTYLYMALANCEPFNARTAKIGCTITNLGGHMVVGIDERDLGSPPNPENIYYLKPGDGESSDSDGMSCIPDTRYAFLELTSQNPIGRYSESMYTIHRIEDTSNLSCAPKYR